MCCVDKGSIEDHLFAFELSGVLREKLYIKSSRETSFALIVKLLTIFQGARDVWNSHVLPKSHIYFIFFYW